MTRKFKEGDIVWNSEKEDLHRIKKMEYSCFESDRDFNPSAKKGLYYTTNADRTNEFYTRKATEKEISKHHKKSNMKKTLTGYKVTNSYPGGPAVGTVVGTTDKIAPLMPDCYQPLYKNEAELTTLSIGSNGMRVEIGNGSIVAENGSVFTRGGLDALRMYIRRVNNATPQRNTGGYEISVKENWRFIRIGCSDEDHRVSLEELDKVIAEYDRINS